MQNSTQRGNQMGNMGEVKIYRIEREDLKRTISVIEGEIRGAIFQKVMKRIIFKSGK